MSNTLRGEFMDVDFGTILAWLIPLAVAVLLWWLSSEDLRKETATLKTHNELLLTETVELRENNKELLKEVATLKKYSAMLLRIMQRNGWVNLRTNEAGELEAILELKGEIHAGASVSRPDLKITEETDGDQP